MKESKSRLFICVLALATLLNIAFVMAPGTALGEGDDGSEEIAYEDVSSDALEEGESEDDSSTDSEPLLYPSRENYEPIASFDEWYDAETGEWLIGVDVSEWNGWIDWEAVKDSGVKFAILRCGGTYEGSSTPYTDEKFEHNARECERVGLPYGVYFYSTAYDAWSAAIEAEYVANLLADYNPSLPVFLDLEYVELSEPENAGPLTEVARTFCGRIAAAGKLPGIYSSASWWEYLLTDPCFDQWAKWVAQYDGHCDVECDCWQYDDDGDMPGFDWPVDLNVWFAK